MTLSLRPTKVVCCSIVKASNSSLVIRSDNPPVAPIPSGTPVFELNGVKYEIKRNRYLHAEFDELKKETEMSDEEQIAYVKEQEFGDRIERLLERKNELYEKFLQTFSEKDEEMYKKACKAYEDLIDESATKKSVVSAQKQKLINIGEKLIIKALQINDKGETIRSEKEATEIWETFVDEYGEISAMQFVVFTINYIIGADEDIENPFIAQAKAKAEQKANMRKGLKMVK